MKKGTENHELAKVEGKGEDANQVFISNLNINVNLNINISLPPSPRSTSNKNQLNRDNKMEQVK
jgi:hypothetical protein